MKTGWRRTLLMGICAIAAGSGAAASAPAGEARSGDRLAEAGRCFDRQTALIPFSGIVLLDLNGSALERAAGTADPEGQAKMTRSTQFRLASVQKVLTRIAVGRLVDRKKLEFDAPVGRYVKNLPAEFAAITVDQLLHHRSGVAGFGRMPRETMEALASARSARDLLPLIVAQPLEFRPGEREAYSNGGYLLLGVVIEAVTGKEYGEYLEEAIYRPLGMSSTGLTSGPATAIRKSKMTPGHPPSPTPRPTRPPVEPRGTAAGDGVSTADDMMKLGKALLSDSLLKPSTKARLFPAKPGKPWRIGQSGGSIGINTDFAVYPESGLISIVLSNFDPPAGDAMGLVLRRAALGLGCNPIREEDAPGPRPSAPPERRPG